MERVLAVIAGALAGLLALLSLASADLAPQFIVLASFTAMISASLIAISLPLVALLVALTSISLSILSPLVVIAVGAAIALISRRAEPVALSIGFSGLALYVTTGDPASLSLSLLSIAALSVASSKRPHALVAILSPALPLVAGAEVSIMALVLLGAMYLWLGSSPSPTCPFRRDSRLAFYGTVTGVLGIVAYFISSSLLSYGLWLVGLTMLISGIASPTRDEASPKA